jgi:polyphosphate kinase
LRPGVPGVSDNIRCRSIVDRFLEHTRVCCFLNGGEPEYYLSSADWMQRNLDRRIELAFPVLDKRLHPQLWDFLQLQLADNVKARLYKADGLRVPLPKSQPRVRSQERLLAAAQGLGKAGQWGSLKVEAPQPEANPAPVAEKPAAST